MQQEFSSTYKADYRSYIDKLRKKFESLPNKTPEDQQIQLEFVTKEHLDSIDSCDNVERKLALICIKSGAKNALSGKMISELVDVVDKLEHWALNEGVKGVLIYGHGGTFCSGSDLVSVRGTLSLEDGLHLAEVMQYNLMRIQQLPVVSVAYLDGYALGGGAELSLAADMRIMTASAKIGFVHAKVGVCCGWGGGARLLELVGPSRACDLLSSGRLVRAQEALSLGLSNALVSSKAEAIQFLAKRTLTSSETLRALKAMLNGARLLSIGKALAQEAQLFASTWGQEAHVKALDGGIKHNNNDDDGSKE